MERNVTDYNTIELGDSVYPVADVLEALEPQIAPRRLERMNSVLERRLTSLVLGLEDVRHNHNATACLRTAESLGIHDVVAVETSDGYPWPMDAEPLARKITMYSDRWIDLHRLESAAALSSWARRRNMQVLGTSPHATMTLADVPMDVPTLVLFGNEGEGLRADTQSICDDVFKLPMYGFTESFNLSVTVGMTLSALSRITRQKLANEDRLGDMPMERQQYIKAHWYCKSVRRSDLILKRKLTAQG